MSIISIRAPLTWAISASIFVILLASLKSYPFVASKFPPIILYLLEETVGSSPLLTLAQETYKSLVLIGPKPGVSWSSCSGSCPNI